LMVASEADVSAADQQLPSAFCSPHVVLPGSKQSLQWVLLLILLLLGLTHGLASHGIASQGSSKPCHVV
jgi:hypothetical protein